MRWWQQAGVGSAEGRGDGAAEVEYWCGEMRWWQQAANSTFTLTFARNGRYGVRWGVSSEAVGCGVCGGRLSVLVCIWSMAVGYMMLWRECPKGPSASAIAGCSGREQAVAGSSKHKQAASLKNARGKTLRPANYTMSGWWDPPTIR
eukprot:366455-Chlamydomonas_euryale.AAC.4